MANRLKDKFSDIKHTAHRKAEETAEKARKIVNKLLALKRVIITLLIIFCIFLTGAGLYGALGSFGASPHTFCDPKTDSGCPIDACSVNGGVGGLTGDAIQVYKYLVGEHLSDNAVAGILANMQAESSVTAKTSEKTDYSKGIGLNSAGMTDDDYTSQVDNGVYKAFVTDGIGYGLVQFTSSSYKEALLDTAQAQAKSISDVDIQMKVFVDELKASGVFDKLNDSSLSARDATQIMLEEYEKPSAFINKDSYPEKYQEMLDTRSNYASSFLSRMAIGISCSSSSSSYLYNKADGENVLLIDYTTLFKGMNAPLWWATIGPTFGNTCAYQCTTYAKYRFTQVYGVTYDSNGNGIEVAPNIVASSNVSPYFQLTSTPTAGSIGSCTTDSSAGHVFFVERVDGDTMWISEGNVENDTLPYGGLWFNHPVSVSTYQNEKMATYANPIGGVDNVIGELSLKK